MHRQRGDDRGGGASRARAALARLRRAGRLRHRRQRPVSKPKGGQTPVGTGFHRPSVVLYTRPGCHLCDEALVVLERVRALTPFDLEQRDIETDEEWLRAYLERIPVVEIDGEEVFEFHVDEAELRRRVGRVPWR
ncbi:MAG: glutaredoxin family protein [Solirubrobacteraceae bacterium]